MTDALHFSDPLALLEDYDFELPAASIAQEALPERDRARLMVTERETGTILQSGANHQVRDLSRWLRAGDLLVVNATRVVPAKLLGTKRSGGAAEALLLGRDPVAPGDFRALLKCTGRVREGLELIFGPPPGLTAQVVSRQDRGEVSLRFAPGVDPYSAGQAPLPPYIRRPRTETDPERERSDLDRYQTVYAREPGAIAAPTAGLHLTEELLERLEAAGGRKGRGRPARWRGYLPTTGRGGARIGAAARGVLHPPGGDRRGDRADPPDRRARDRRRNHHDARARKLCR